MKRLKRNEDKFNFLVKLVLDNLFEKLNESKYKNKYNYLKDTKLEIRLDNRNVKNSYNDKLEDYLIKQSHFSYKYNIDIKKCSYHDSKRTREVQMADYIANIFWTIKNHPNTESVVKRIPNWDKNSFLWEYPKNIVVMNKPNLKISRKNLTLVYNNSFELTLWIDFQIINIHENDIVETFRNYKENYEFKDDGLNNNYFCFINKHWKILIAPKDNFLTIAGVKSKIQNMLDDLKIDINIHKLINS